MKLYDLIPEHKALLELIDEQPGGELSPETEAALDAFFSEIAGDEAAKLDSYVHVIRTMELKAAAAQSEIDQYTARKRSAEAAVKRLKDRVKTYMEITGRTKVTTATGRTFAIQKNGGNPPMDIDSDVPAEFLFQPPPVPDRELILAALKDGKELPFARLLPAGTHLRIR